MIDIEQRRKVQDLIQEGKYDSAEKVLNRMINEEPEEASIHNSLGDVLAKLDRTEEALEHFGKAGDDKFSEAYFIKAMSYDKQGKFEDAKKEYLKYLKSKPSLKEPPVLQSCLAMIRLDPDDNKWVIRFAKVAAAKSDDVSLKLAIETASKRKMKETGQFEQMLKKLNRKLKPDTAVPVSPPSPPPQKETTRKISETDDVEITSPPPLKETTRKISETEEVIVTPPLIAPEEIPVEETGTETLDITQPTASIDEVEFEESDFIETLEEDDEGKIKDSILSERKRIGEYFIAEGLLEASDVLKALDIQKGNGSEKRLGDILVGMNLVSVKQLQEALSLQVEDMRSNLDRSRGDGLGYVELGNLLLEVGDFYGAIDSYLRACTIYRANEREYMVFELLEGVLDICPESLSAAKEIVRIRNAMDVDGQARAFYRLSVAYLLNDSPHEALAALEESVSVDSSFEMARTLMDGIRPGLADSDDYADIAMILADIDRKFDRDSARSLAGIIKDFQDGIDTAVPIDDFNTHYDLGIAYMEMGLYRESLSEFEQVLKSPDFRMKAREMLGRCCLFLERYDEAEDHFRKGLSTTAGDLRSSVGFHLAIADVYRATGRDSQAEKELAAASKLDPEMVKVQRSLG
jgi:tetratricopeptide (TPR) repeat protein